MDALVIGGTGRPVRTCSQDCSLADYDVSILHRGVHEPPDLPDVHHIHADPHFRETVSAAIGSRTWDVVIATYGRLATLAEIFVDRCGHFIGVGGVPVYQGLLEPERSIPHGMRLLAREDGPLAATEATSSTFSAKVVRAEQAVISRCAARNAAGVLLAAVDHPEVASGEAFNVCDDDQLTTSQWVQSVARLAGRDLDLIGIPSNLTPSTLAELLPPAASPHILVSAQKAKDVLGYREVVSADDALAETVAWLGRNLVTEADRPAYRPRFDYDAEDRLIAVWRRASEWVLQQVPDDLPAMAHPMPHPRSPSLSVDERGR